MMMRAVMIAMTMLVLTSLVFPASAQDYWASTRVFEGDPQYNGEFLWYTDVSIWELGHALIHNRVIPAEIYGAQPFCLLVKEQGVTDLLGPYESGEVVCKFSPLASVYMVFPKSVEDFGAKDYDSYGAWTLLRDGPVWVDRALCSYEQGHDPVVSIVIYCESTDLTERWQLASNLKADLIEALQLHSENAVSINYRTPRSDGPDVEVYLSENYLGQEVELKDKIRRRAAFHLRGLVVPQVKIAWI